jgi:hypothetical protein
MTKELTFDGIPREELARLCKQTVQNSGMTQREVADELDVSQPAIQHTFKPEKHVDRLRMKLLRTVGEDESFDEDRLVKYIQYRGEGYVILLPEDEAEVPA